MAAGDMKGLIHVGLDILNTTLNEATGKILVQLGNVIGETTDTDNAELWQQYGFASRAPKPDAGKAAAQAVVLRAGDHDIVMATQDQRALEIYGRLGYGEACVFSAGEDGLGQARSLWKKDGSITHYTTVGNKKGTTGIYSRVGPGVDADTGLPDGFSWAAPWGTMKWDETGFHLLHKSGAEFHLGAIGGLPSPFDAMSSYCSVQAGSFTTVSSGQSLGAGAALPLASAPAVLATVAALQVEIAALQIEIAAVAAALVAVTNIAPLLPAHATAAAPATAAVGVGAAAVVVGAAAVAAEALLTPTGTMAAL